MKANIIGAGVAGLSAGCYLRMNGFETEIFERHSAPGGLCTSWQRKGYTFESGLQWLLGSGESNPFFQLWSELIDMHSIRFIHHEVRMEIEVKNAADINGDKVFHLYTNLERLEGYLLSIGPEDEHDIRALVRSMRRMQAFEIPPMIKSQPGLLPWYRKIRYAKYLPLLFFMKRVSRETNFTFADKLKNPFLKEAFRLLFDGEELPLMIVTLPLAFNDLHGTGYPAGGSAGFVGKLLERYENLGGKIRYNADVARIMTLNDRANGVELSSGEEFPSGIVISAADWNFTVFRALGGKYVNASILALASQQRLKVYYSVFMVSLGVNADLSGQPHFLRFPLAESLVSPDGTAYERMEVLINNYDRGAAPAGKTVVSLSYYTQKADFWISLREEDYTQYLEKKQEFAGGMIRRAEEKIPALKGKIDVIDIATPATYHRYTGNWHGSVQGWLPGKNMIEQSPVKSELPGLKDFYFIGHWTIPGGGLPVAVKSARDAVQTICHRMKMPFRVEES